jgi:SpoVK/Ycf46/Vps4 family AAA+-type ATPase
MGDLADLELIIKSRIPLLLIETHEELRAIDMLKRLILKQDKPLFLWSATEGLKRLDIDLGTQSHNAEPTAVLRHIKSSTVEGIFILLDFHPYLDEAINVRLMKEVALAQHDNGHHIILISHDLELPDELGKLSARFEMSLPDRDHLLQLVKEEAFSWSRENGNKKVKTDSSTLELLVRNLAGLTVSDARRLARKVIHDDGAITEEDLPEVMSAKHELLSQDGLLAFEYETEKFSDIGGMPNLRRWLELRKAFFHMPEPGSGMEPPRGIMLLGVQGCGKSLASRAVAGVLGVPLLRLDFGVLYNKYFGESEKNLRAALKTAELMAPCVLWIDEIEKGISSGDNDGGTSRRILGTVLTWMSEKNLPVFMVATANDIESLPPELVRKGRFDEIFFVDLPDHDARRQIISIHFKKRGQATEDIDLDALADAAQGFSGAEIEQAVVSALYAVYARGGKLTGSDILEELKNTRPLSVVMAEKISYLQQWAQERTMSV